MKKTFLNFLIILIVSLSGCTTNDKLTVRVLSDGENKIHWYYESLITSNSPDKIDFVDSECNSELIFKGHRVTNLTLMLDTLYIECYHCAPIFLDSNFIYPIKIKEVGNYDEYNNFLLHRDSMKRIYKKNDCF